MLRERGNEKKGGKGEGRRVRRDGKGDECFNSTTRNQDCQVEGTGERMNG